MDAITFDDVLLVPSYNHWESRRIVDISMNPEFASNFAVEITPTIILVHKATQEYLLVSSGVISMENLQRRLFRSVRFMRGETTVEQWATFEFEKNSGHDPMKFIKGK